MLGLEQDWGTGRISAESTRSWRMLQRSGWKNLSPSATFGERKIAIIEWQIGHNLRFNILRSGHFLRFVNYFSCCKKTYQQSCSTFDIHPVLWGSISTLTILNWILFCFLLHSSVLLNALHDVSTAPHRPRVVAVSYVRRADEELSKS